MRRDSSSRTSLKYSSSSLRITGPRLRRMNSAVGKPCSAKNIIRTSADLSRNAVFRMCELKSMSPQPANSCFSNMRRSAIVSYSLPHPAQRFGPRDVVAFGVRRARSEHFQAVAARAVAGFDERRTRLHVIVAVVAEHVSVADGCAVGLDPEQVRRNPNHL